MITKATPTSHPNLVKISHTCCDSIVLWSIYGHTFLLRFARRSGSTWTSVWRGYDVASVVRGGLFFVVVFFFPFFFPFFFVFPVELAVWGSAAS